jgi:peptidylprolyl isomerase
MASDPKKNPTPAGPDRKQMMRVLIPAAAIALVVVLVAVVTSLSGGGGRKMSDGSDGSESDPGLRDVGGGVKARDLKEGSGEPCPPGAKVKIHYTGWLTDGTVFDSSKERGQPVEFALRNLIGGWQLGIPGMKPGGVRKLVVPPNQGYGSQTKGKIPPGSTLIFEVELIEVVKTKMSDGSDGSHTDPGLKDIGQGLKIRDLKEGSGQPCPEGAKVVIHYTGWTIDGNVFDTSKRGENFPVTFELKGLIQGWQKGIPGMKPGGIRKLVIPPELGYGSQDSPDIPANSTLIFEVELVEVK